MLYYSAMGRGTNSDKILIQPELDSDSVSSVEQLFANQDLTGITVLDAAGPGWVAPGSKDLLIDNGEDFSDNQRLNLDDWKQLPKTSKQCFYNATSAALDYPEQLTYVEGYAIPDSEINFPMLHAWVVDQNDQLLDPTWKNSGAAYYGIRFSNKLLSECLVITEEYGVLNCLWWNEELRDKFSEMNSSNHLKSGNRSSGNNDF